MFLSVIQYPSRGTWMRSGKIALWITSRNTHSHTGCWCFPCITVYIS